MSETSQSLPRRQNLFARRVIWFGAGVLGAAQALPSPYRFATDDAVSYLDIADAYLKHHWSHALNGYWSPLYSWVLAIALWIGRPSPRSEILVLRATNLALFFGACAGFTFFLYRLMADHRERMLLDHTLAGVVRVPDWMWLAFGYDGLL